MLVEGSFTDCLIDDAAKNILLVVVFLEKKCVGCFA